MTHEETYRDAMRRIIASLSSAVVVLGLLVGVAPSIQAADLGTVTISDSGPGIVLSPTTIAGQPSDTFTVTNGAVTTAVRIVNAVGQVRDSTGACTPPGCFVSPGSSKNFTIEEVGSIEVRDNAGVVVLATLTITAGGSAGATDPALVYPTATIDANGGTCTGTMQFTKYNGQNGTVTLPTGETCTRSDYTLLGWARTADATSIEWPPGTTVPIGTDSFTAYAVWRPNGLLLTYAANVGMDVACMKDGVNQSTSAERSVSRVITPASVGEAIR